MNNQEPSFCFIAPTSYLDFTTASKTHLVLAHLLDTDPEYAAFYKARSDAGDYIMCDNSAYELKEPFSPTKLVKLATACGAHAIVLPDFPFQHSSVTIAAAEEFIPVFKDAGFETFFVPQSLPGDKEDWISCYEYAANHPDIDIIGMSILGIPVALEHVDPSFSRVVMTSILQERNLFASNKKHHYLGLNSGAALEIPTLLRMGVMDTIDSSGPIWSAILGHSYTNETESFQSVKKIKMPVIFDIDRTKDDATLKRIQHNVDMTIGLFNTQQYRDVWYANE